MGWGVCVMTKSQTGNPVHPQSVSTSCPGCLVACTSNCASLLVLLLQGWWCLLAVVVAWLVFREIQGRCRARCTRLLLTSMESSSCNILASNQVRLSLSQALLMLDKILPHSKSNILGTFDISMKYVQSQETRPDMCKLLSAPASDSSLSATCSALCPQHTQKVFVSGHCFCLGLTMAITAH